MEQSARSESVMSHHKFKPAEGILSSASLPIAADKIPNGLSLKDRNMLLANCDRTMTNMQVAWFRDCPEVRRILGIREPKSSG